MEGRSRKTACVGEGVACRMTLSNRKEPFMTLHSWHPKALARRALVSLFAFACVAAPAIGQPQNPEAPARRVFAAWLTSLNSADTAAFRAFDATYRSEAPPPIEGRLAFREG